MGVFPSGQRGQTVNLLAMPSVVRIHPLPPRKKTDAKHRSFFNEIRSCGTSENAYGSEILLCNVKCASHMKGTNFISLDVTTSNFTIYIVNYFTSSKARYFTNNSDTKLASATEEPAVRKGRNRPKRVGFLFWWEWSCSPIVPSSNQSPTNPSTIHWMVLFLISFALYANVCYHETEEV